jgi:hypothetical protein
MAWTDLVTDHVLAAVFFPLLWLWAFTLKPHSRTPPQ